MDVIAELITQALLGPRTEETDKEIIGKVEELANSFPLYEWAWKDVMDEVRALETQWEAEKAAKKAEKEAEE